MKKATEQLDLPAYAILTKSMLIVEDPIEVLDPLIVRKNDIEVANVMINTAKILSEYNMNITANTNGPVPVELEHPVNSINLNVNVKNKIRNIYAYDQQFSISNNFLQNNSGTDMIFTISGGEGMIKIVDSNNSYGVYCILNSDINSINYTVYNGEYYYKMNNYNDFELSFGDGNKRIVAIRDNEYDLDNTYILLYKESFEIELPSNN